MKLTSLSRNLSALTTIIIILSVQTWSSDDVIIRLSRRFGDDQTLDFWTSENSKTSSGISSVIDCMSLCLANTTCWSYGYDEGSKECTHYNTAYRVEEKAVTQIQDFYIFSVYWLGGQDVITEDVWFWTKTKENLTYFVWDGHTSQPNEGTEQNCLATYLQRSSPPAHWHDKECDEKLAYPICERLIRY
ncbi:hypothetical protein FSP39_005802 [Pinctada imbricata]|uniref:C-type lectin domain-containing protein n=1 Tax=Pinctada imbricata TaxID=66713 RepID=A0AA89CD61_PINIB|nr:hypothetical protein FSP39_005802 [Pinctada imbricata]